VNAVSADNILFPHIGCKTSTEFHISICKAVAITRSADTRKVLILKRIRVKCRNERREANKMVLNSQLFCTDATGQAKAFWHQVKILPV